MTFLDKMLGLTGSSPDSSVDAIVDRLVRSTDKRLMFVQDYRDRLRAPVLSAWGRMREAVARIPGPTEVGAASWRVDSTVRALFATAADAADSFSKDEGIRRFFVKQPAASECLAMLSLEIRERHVLAPAVHGENLQAEAARTTVSFAEPLILAPRADEPCVRAELALRGLEYLALRALERVGAARLQREKLEAERALLRAQLRLAASRGAGLGGIGSARMSKVGVEADLERTVRELEMAASHRLLPDLLDEMVAVLANSQTFLELRACAFALDSMNFKVDPSEPQAVTPRIGVLSLAAQGGPFGVLIARFPRSELRPAASFANAPII